MGKKKEKEMEEGGSQKGSRTKSKPPNAGREKIKMGKDARESFANIWGGREAKSVVRKEDTGGHQLREKN